MLIFVFEKKSAIIFGEGCIPSGCNMKYISVFIEKNKKKKTSAIHITMSHLSKNSL